MKLGFKISEHKVKLGQELPKVLDHWRNSISDDSENGIKNQRGQGGYIRITKHSTKSEFIYLSNIWQWNII